MFNFVVDRYLEQQYYLAKHDKKSFISNADFDRKWPETKGHLDDLNALIKLRRPLVMQFESDVATSHTSAKAFFDTFSSATLKSIKLQALMIGKTLSVCFPIRSILMSS